MWDEAKNKHNFKVHHVDFETAMFVFNDQDRIEIYDESHSEDEDRWDVISSGHLAIVEEYNPATMVIKTLTPEMILTSDQIKMLEEAGKFPIVYEEDCPEMTPEMAEAFRKAAIARNRRKAEVI